MSHIKQYYKVLSIHIHNPTEFNKHLFIELQQTRWLLLFA